MKFHASFDIPRLPWPISHRHSLLLIGSCFTEAMGEKLVRNKFSVLQNPSGILFNPVSVAETLTDIIDQTETKAGDLFCLNEAWHSWKHHSRFSALTPEAALALMNRANEEAHLFLKKADYLVITLGSAWTYMLTEAADGNRTGKVAANNHKAPAAWFTRKLLTVEDVLQVLDNLIHRLFFFNAKLKILFTISPVRHLREGFVENNRSKAVLIQAIHHLVHKFDGLYYFPAYELVIDDLRDYRFYAEDLVHPNYAATQYVWEKFIAACLTAESQEVLEQLPPIQQAYQHKPFHAGSVQHQRFLQSSLQKTEALSQKYPYLDFSRELAYFAGKGTQG